MTFAPSIILIDSNMTLKGCFFLNNKGSDEKAVIQTIRFRDLNPVFLIIETSIFLNNTALDLNISSYPSLIFRDCTLQKLKSQKNLPTSSTLIINGVSEIQLESIRVEGVRGISSIRIFSPHYTTQITLKDSQFINCYSEKSGGALTIEGSFKGKITKTHFLNTSSNANGGAMSLICSEIICDIVVESCIFTGVSARYQGALLENIFFNSIMENNVLELKQPPKGFSSICREASQIFLIKYFPENSDFAGEFFINNGIYFENVTKVLDLVNSGQNLNLFVVLADSYNNTILASQDDTISITSSSNTTFVENGYLVPTNGFFIFNNLKIVSPPGEKVNLTIKYIDNLYRRVISTDLETYFRRCTKGEYPTGLKCESCPKGYFSLSYDPITTNTKSCTNCPDFANCMNGHQIFPIKGFWRKDENQTLIVKCLIEDSCPGGGVFIGLSFRPSCSPGYSGNICRICEKNFGYNGEYECAICTNNPTHYLKFFLLSLLAFIWVVYQAKKSLQITIEESKKRSMIKVLVDHLSYISFLKDFQIKWSVFAITFFTVGDNYINPCPKEMFAFECFLDKDLEPIEKFIDNSTLVSFTPLFNGVVCIVILLIFELISKKKA